MARNEHGPEFFVDAFTKEHPGVIKKGHCLFANSSISGLTSRYRKKELPKGTVPKGTLKER